MANPSRSSRATRAVAGAVAYVTAGGLFLGGGIVLRAMVDAGAEPAAVAPAVEPAPRTTETTLPLPVVVLPTTTTAAPPTTVAHPVAVAAATPPAPAPATPPTTAAPAPAVAPDRRAIWFALADCESGRWGAGKIPIPGTATWTVVDEVHQGGLQIRAGQWDQHRPPGFPPDAHVATPEQQIAVAEIILAGQGWWAWPTCGPRVGLERLVG